MLNWQRMARYEKVLTDETGRIIGRVKESILSTETEAYAPEHIGNYASVEAAQTAVERAIGDKP